MTSSAILPHPIKPIADLPVDAELATALLSSMAEYGEKLHGRRLWLACSGGRDSLALAALCVQLYRQGKLPFYHNCYMSIMVCKQIVVLGRHMSLNGQQRSRYRVGFYVRK